MEESYNPQIHICTCTSNTHSARVTEGVPINNTLSLAQAKAATSAI